ncbi:T9SS type A sorting domain-containing protein [Scytonema sp. UIC 10036]|uniref:CAP domain-containing protein n=1 Tax=Scytonema sp. UIC 10036 TaxID=2304196 RepID=UPI0012DAA58A|nr:CAP domain-containing protein [Scytonema sp. UIC 10036]MUG92389.1 T9SS type A sorting domain-containing protein [Scytonema sp. UIC 10036]
MSVNAFDVNFYRSANPDLKNLTDAQALSHFQNFGLAENRLFSPLVDLSFYRASNSDLANFSNQQAYDHLSNYGISQGRRFSPFFDLNFYRQNNADLASLSNEQLFDHLRTSGLTEGRQASPFVDISMSRDYAGNALNLARNIVLNSQTVVYRESIGDADQNDYYRVDLSSQNTNLNLRLNGLSANADVQLLNSTGQIISASTNGSAANEALSFSNLQAGTYYVRVYQGVGGANTNYNLSLSGVPTSSPVPTSVPQPLSAGNNSFIQSILDLTNAERQKAGVQLLQLSDKLNNSAQTHVQNMALNDFFSHTDSNGSSVGNRAIAAGFQYSTIGENIAAGQSTPQQVFQGWMNSPEHRANILNPVFQFLGVGYYYLAHDTGTINYNHYWVQDLGTLA